MPASPAGGTSRAGSCCQPEQRQDLKSGLLPCLPLFLLVPCLKILLSKGLGLGIVAGSLLGTYPRTLPSRCGLRAGRGSPNRKRLACLQSLCSCVVLLSPQ